MGLVSLLFRNPALFAILAILLLYSIILHEIAHGWVAHLFGDDTAVRSGRLTLNPVSHIDPVGVLMLFFVGFGWAVPVPVDYRRLRQLRLGLFSVALAGCATNILIAAGALFLLQFEAVGANPVLSLVLPVLVRINIILGAFNLIPIPPLDGSRILMSILPEEAQMGLARFERYGFYLLVFLLFTGMLNPLIDFLQRLIYIFIVAIFSIPRLWMH